MRGTLLENLFKKKKHVKFLWFFLFVLYFTRRFNKNFV